MHKLVSNTALIIVGSPLGNNLGNKSVAIELKLYSLIGSWLTFSNSFFFIILAKN